MAAYLVAEVDVFDPEGYERYRPFAMQAIAMHGGKYLARSTGHTESLEGDAPKRMVILEFESMEAARRFYFSKEYSEARKMREKVATTRLFLVEGVRT